MRLLLRKDIPKLGQVGDVVDVSAGYARNYLIPQHLAVEPTPANLRAIEDDKKQAAQERIRLETDLRRRAENLRGAEVTIAAAANPEGHLYGSVGVREIAAALRELGHKVEASQVQLGEPIRQLDTQPVEIRLREDITAEVKVWVVRERAADRSIEEERDRGPADFDAHQPDRAADPDDA